MKTIVPYAKKMTARNGAVIMEGVPLLGIEPGPTEPESVILSFKLQRRRDCKVRKKILDEEADFDIFADTNHKTHWI